MPAISRLGDSVLSPDGTGYKCRMPMKTSVGEGNSDSVYANGVLITVQGNKVAPHPKPGCTVIDTSGLDSGSGQVFIGGKGVGRIGDSMGDNVITQGSPTVFAS
jgi:uncharacterized Zn-binding protein involved in type VI secretion